ncbi:MAG: sel1 repeat family protein [Deltaproteobacteria bacterium]|jgi:TPR repeat protein|nr:sel1 repeat family protein [Deltaproteobacteria bacterium]
MSDDTEKDQNISFSKLRHSASLGNADAQILLAVLFMQGALGGELDFPTNMIEAEAASGNGRAQDIMGYFSLQGTGGMPQSSEQAIEWFKKAASNGQSLAALRLGRIYSSGEFVKKDDAEAFKWYKLAADSGEPESQCFIGACYLMPMVVAQDIEKAFNYLSLSASQGFDSAIYNLGLMYFEGIYVKQNYKQALALFEEAGNLGHLQAQLNASYIYDKGMVGVPRDKIKANRWLGKARREHSDEFF